MFAFVSPLCREGSVTGNCMEFFPAQLTEILTFLDHIEWDEWTRLTKPNFERCLRLGWDPVTGKSRVIYDSIIALGFLITFSFVKNAWSLYWLLISNSLPRRRSSTLETSLLQVEVFRCWWRNAETWRLEICLLLQIQAVRKMGPLAFWRKLLNSFVPMTVRSMENV